MAKYIRCNNCGEKIMFGAFAYHYEYDAVYCCEECYCSATANGGIVDDKFANACDCQVYDDDARVAEIRKEMEEHRMAMEKLYEEMQRLTAQN